MAALERGKRYVVTYSIKLLTANIPDEGRSPEIATAGNNIITIGGQVTTVWFDVVVVVVAENKLSSTVAGNLDAGSTVDTTYAATLLQVVNSNTCVG